MKYEQILMKFFGGMVFGPRTKYLDFGIYPNRDLHPGIC